MTAGQALSQILAQGWEVLGAVGKEGPLILKKGKAKILWRFPPNQTLTHQEIKWIQGWARLRI